MKRNNTARMLSALLAALLLMMITACGAGTEQNTKISSVSWTDLKQVGTMELSYAEQFSAAKYEDGYVLLSIRDSGEYLIIPEGGEIPNELPEGMTVIRRPLKNIYLVATSAMDLFRHLEAIPSIRLSGTDANGWTIPEAAQALEDGEMLFAGKYNAPDYELILENGCDLAIESTMIYHSPEVREKLEALGIPVLVERSSYESDPLARMEWIKVYGLLTGTEELAEQVFAEQTDGLPDASDRNEATAAFFYITSNGAANVRKSGDYVTKMIDMAGGTYVFSDLEDNGNALSTMNMDLETFYAGAKDADVLIYNSTIDGTLTSIDQLLDKSALLADFKAVQNGRVWCTEKSLFQESMALGTMIRELHTILTEDTPEEASLQYFHRLS